MQELLTQDCNVCPCEVHWDTASSLAREKVLSGLGEMQKPLSQCKTEGEWEGRHLQGYFLNNIVFMPSSAA